MKKLHTLIFTISLLIAGSVNAQINKGAVFLGGDLGGSVSNTKRDGHEITKWEGINFSPVFGKAIRQNLVLGFDALINLSHNEISGSPASRSRAYGAGVFLRKYQQLGKSNFSLFLQGRLGAQFQKSVVNTFYRNEAKAFAIALSAYPGLSYSVSKRLQLETGFNNLLSMGYIRERRISEGQPALSEKSSSFSLSTNLNNMASLYAGFRLLLNK